MSTNIDDMQDFVVPGMGYGYSAMEIDKLGSMENTIVLGLYDESGSVHPFARDIEEQCCKSVVEALKLNPRADNLIYRQVHFNQNYREIHGFRPLIQLNGDDYKGTILGGGTTSLFDSTCRALDELAHYAAEQVKKKCVCNGLLYIITDGVDVGSTLTENSVKDKYRAVLAEENLESLVVILVGVTGDPNVEKYLKNFFDTAGFTAYIDMKEATGKNFARLGGFISQSVSSQSQMIGTGGPSQAINSLTI